MTSKRIKYLRIKLTKKVNDLDTEHYKTFLKVMKEDLIKWKDIPLRGLEDVILLKCQYCLKRSID